MTFSENLISSPSVVSRSISRIILYLPVADLSTLHLHVTIFVALNDGNQKSTFTFFVVVNFLDMVFHIDSTVFYLNFNVSIPITMVELLPMFNSI